MSFFDKHTHRDKHLLRLERELNRLRHAQWNAPIIPLEHPYQRGWVKTFVLRDDVPPHPEAQVFSAVLKMVNQRVHAPTREFVTRRGHVIALRPRIVEVHAWHRLNWSLRHQRLFAYGTWPVEEIYPWSQRYYRSNLSGFKLMRTWWLVEHVSPHIITHQRVELPEVRSRIAEIEAHLEARQGHHRLSWLHGRHSHWHARAPSREQQRSLAVAHEQLTSTPD